MSRSYKNVIKCGFCYGSNTEFYRDRNRKARHLNRHNLRNLMANHNIDDVSDLVTIVKFPHDSWNEPTDGTYLISRHSKRNYYENPIVYRNGETSTHYWDRKFGKYLKPKNRNHYRIVK